jgi:uncharacterized delta-60 repeat protein
MNKSMKVVFGGIAAILLANGPLVWAAHSQIVDSLNVTTGRTSNNAEPTVYDVVPLPDGRILVGGSCITFISSANQVHTNLARLNPDGSVDDSFQVNIGYVRCLALQTNGQILVGGDFTAINGQLRYNLGRLNSDGTLDSNFNAGYIYANSGTLNCIRMQPDGKLLVGGDFTYINTHPCIGLCRLNGDGSLDTNFNANANNIVSALALQPDGRIVVEGIFTSIGGQPQTNLARLNTDGSIDSSFHPATLGTIGAPWGVLLVQPNGEILVGGVFDRVNGLSHTNVALLEADGTLDVNFAAQADRRNCWGVQTLALQTDGKILVGNDAPTLDGHSCPYFGRLNADGSLDASFNTNVIGNGDMVYSTVVQADGRILVGGLFYELGGQSRDGLGRLGNTGPATQSITYDGTNLLWLRGGTSPEVWRTSFESSSDGTNWAYWGDGVRVAGGWQLAHVGVVTNGQIRARGFVAGGCGNGSSWFLESVYPQTAPVIGGTLGNPGFQNSQFGFKFCGSAGSTVVIDASNDWLNWLPIAPNMLPCGPLTFSDPAATNSPQRFYRARLQP